MTADSSFGFGTILERRTVGESLGTDELDATLLEKQETIDNAPIVSFVTVIRIRLQWIFCCERLLSEESAFFPRHLGSTTRSLSASLCTVLVLAIVF